MNISRPFSPWSMRFWEALTCIKRTSGSRVTAPSFQQPFTCDLFMSYLADRRTDCSHPFCAGTPSFTPFFGLPELAKRPRIGCASPSSAWYDQDEHVSSVLGEILVAPFVLCFWVLPLYLDNHGSSRYANYTVGKASFESYERHLPFLPPFITPPPITPLSSIPTPPSITPSLLHHSLHPPPSITSPVFLLP
ncbi:uncharacterized protein LACBIDRAFT_332760 [Laccaria bicolor S238N-H82]|uniref:Predicted protein n=1 Tax=Laccaria bicolor (strain S238N-H82 / ATCC MYA-4686) TaxID=486041 RepID=B0DU00_LACBS|nr:uncharacterized protein LACBIDRAFT_332760 [Laccaria bicolor S238N-H82]EDR02000.1 predicted protein [Laccaria bicolor S238N-H82]|eukprot:XP_001887391.1 predicted protein [Laccaria bicolor S238N-H82]